MRATRTSRTAGRRAAVRRGAKRSSKRVAKRTAPKPVAKPVGKAGVLLKKRPAILWERALYKLCKPGWAVIVDRAPNAMGTRFVCPFCPKSHRVPGPVRGFKKMRHAPWGRLRRVEE